MTGSREHSAEQLNGNTCFFPPRPQEYARGRVALLGDAAHLATAMLGMGCSLALEDACELGRAIGGRGQAQKAF